MSTTRTVEEHYGDLQIEYDMRAQRREWLATSIAVVVMALVVAAALCGLLGPGKFSDAEATSPDGLLRVEYQRVLRLSTDSRLKIVIKPRAGTARLTLAGLDDRIEISTVQPQASHVIEGPANSRQYVFDVEPGQESAITFELRPVDVLRLHLKVMLDDTSTVAASSVVLP